MIFFKARKCPIDCVLEVNARASCHFVLKLVGNRICKSSHKTRAVYSPSTTLFELQSYKIMQTMALRGGHRSKAGARRKKKKNDYKMQNISSRQTGHWAVGTVVSKSKILFSRVNQKFFCLIVIKAMA